MASQDDSQWIKLHTRIMNHPKVEGLSDKAFRVLVGIWCWCDDNDTDGLIQRSRFGNRGPRRALNELLASGLIDEVEPGGDYQAHDYLDWQRSAHSKRARKVQAAEAGRSGGLAKAKRKASESLSETLSENLAEVDENRTEQPPLVTKGGQRHEPLHAPDATEPPRCTRHEGDPDPPPCRGCAQARLAAEQAAADELTRRRQAIAGCPDCNGTGWIEDDDRNPTARCTHRKASA